MPTPDPHGPSRRRFLAWLAGSPLFSGQQESDVITEPAQAINVMEFEAAARKILPPAHFGYMATGVDDDATLRANREGFSRLHLRPRRLVDIAGVDLRTQVLGTVWGDADRDRADWKYESVSRQC